MGDFNTDYNVQSTNLEPFILIDEVTGEEIYVGVSKNTRNTTEPNWRIKKIWKDGTIWRIEFPNGDQSYTHVWDDRIIGYSYK